MKRLIIISAIALLSGMTACNQILDQMPYNVIAGSNMWTTESQVDMGVVGVYDALKRPVYGGGVVGAGSEIGYYGLDLFGSTGQGRYNVENFFSSATPNNAKFSFAWRWGYRGIHRANSALDAIPNVDMPVAKRAKLVAEVKALRAFFYMRLNEQFGGGIGIPVYTVPVGPAELTKGQSPESEVWALIIQDLTDAINTPELKNNEIGGEGRVSRGAAYAMRARAYMLTKDYDKAVADYAKVGEMGYALYTGAGVDSYKQLFKTANERCEEMIFGIQYIEEPSGYGTTAQWFLGPYTTGAKDSSTSWTDLQVTPYAVDLYEVLVDENTVKPFVWTDYIPEWNQVTEAEAKRVFFIRDKEYKGNKIAQTITNQVDGSTGLGFAAVTPYKHLYLPEGNEARLKAAYANRDPRLAFNVVTPYADFLGIDGAARKDAVWYTSRWPTGAKFSSDAPASEYQQSDIDATWKADGNHPSGMSDGYNLMWYMHRKFVGEGLEYARRNNNPIDEPIIRYADVLLQWAEVLVEQNKLTDAMAKVKMVRDRAGVPTMASSFADQTTARNYVRDERRRELLGEGVNYLDEMRWKTWKDTKYSQGFPQVAWGGTGGGTIYVWPGDQMYTWPVPYGETQMNPNLTRTPGWEY